MLIGVISDTHGSLDPRVHDVFSGVDRILHAGDVGTGAVLHELALIAPVDAVAGNTDVHGECSLLPDTITVTVGGARIAVVHQLGPFLRRAFRPVSTSSFRVTPTCRRCFRPPP